MFPKVTVLLPVYNGEKYLREAIESILTQTYTNLELLIINDGSSDSSSTIIESYSDQRIRFYSQENQGLAATLNNGISLAKGEYLARQDQDDISLPYRLEKQLDFLENHQDYGMVGTWASILEIDKSTNRYHKHSTENLVLQFELLLHNSFVHSSMMIRRAVFAEVGVYSTDKESQPPEDYELWSRIAQIFPVANIPEVLHVYREMPGSMSRDGDNPFLNNLLKINMKNLSRVTDNAYPAQSSYDLAALAHGEYDKYSGKTSFHVIRALVQDAAKNICLKHSEDIDALDNQTATTLNNLHYHYCQAKYCSILGKGARGVLVQIIRRFKGIFVVFKQFMKG